MTGQRRYPNGAERSAPYDDTQTSRAERRTRLISRLAVLGALFLAIESLIWVGSGRTRPYQFDRMAWAADAPAQRFEPKDNPRSRMVGDLVSNYLKIGMTRQEVRGLLDKPDGESARTDSYDVGRVGPLALDPSLLDLKYDKTYHLVASRVYEP